MAELKPCPFCGGEGIYMATSEGPDFSSGYVRCKKFCCEQSHILPKLGAINYWNRRHEEPKEIEFDYEAEDLRWQVKTSPFVPTKDART